MIEAPLPWPQTKREEEICKKAWELASRSRVEAFRNGFKFGFSLAMAVVIIALLISWPW